MMDAEHLKKMQEGRKASTAKAEKNPVLGYDKKPTRGSAIKAFCAQCMGCNREHVEPGFAKEIRNCTAPWCALYKFRPYQSKKDNHDSEKADA